MQIYCVARGAYADSLCGCSQLSRIQKQDKKTNLNNSFLVKSVAPWLPITHLTKEAIKICVRTHYRKKTKSE